MFDPQTPILVIDDMNTMRKIVMKACRDLGYTKFVEAADGALGWTALNDPASQIGLIISDWNMPNCSGLDLLKRVRGDQRFKHLPFILLTAEAEQHQVVSALEAGVSGYLVKPFNPEALKLKLAHAYLKQPPAKAG